MKSLRIKTATEIVLAAASVVILVASTGCNPRYQPADWAARKSAMNTLPENSAGRTPSFQGSSLPYGTSLPANGTTLPGNTTLPFNGSTLPRGPQFGSTLPLSGTTGSTLPSNPPVSGTTLPYRGRTLQPRFGSTLPN